MIFVFVLVSFGFCEAGLDRFEFGVFSLCRTIVVLTIQYIDIFRVSVVICVCKYIFLV